MEKDISVKRGVVDISLLTWKNMTNCCDITGETLYRHAKEVRANCKKALSLCLKENSPYCNSNGAFPSGADWEDSLFWIRQRMDTVQSKIAVKDLVDEDLSDTENAKSILNDDDRSTSDC